MQADIKFFKEFKEVYESKDRFQKIWMPYDIEAAKGRDDVRSLIDAIPVELGDKTILDIGCNCGAWCAEALHRGARSATGIDKDEEAIDFARALNSFFGYEEKSWFIKSDFSDIDWVGILGADVVFVNQVLYRFPEGEKALDLILKKCREYLMMYTFTLETVDTPNADNVYWIPTEKELNDKMISLGFTCMHKGDVDEGTGKRQFIFRRG